MLKCLKMLRHNTKGYEPFNKLNDGNRSFFKLFIVLGILLCQSERAYYTSAVLAYSLLIPVVLRTQRGAKLLTCLSNNDSVIKNINHGSDLVKEAGESVADSFSLSFSIYICMNEVAKLIFGAALEIGSAWYFPYLFLIFPALYLGYKVKTRNNPLSENAYARGIAFDETGALANIFFKLLIVTKQDATNLINLSVAPILLLAFLVRYVVEKKYIEKIRADNHNKEAPSVSVVTESNNPILEPTSQVTTETDSQRNILVRIIESMKAGWFFTATMLSLIAVYAYNIPKGKSTSQVEDTYIPPEVSWPVIALGFLCFLSAFKLAKTPSSYQSVLSEKKEQPQPQSKSNYGAVV